MKSLLAYSSEICTILVDGWNFEFAKLAKMEKRKNTELLAPLITTAMKFLDTATMASNEGKRPRIKNFAKMAGLNVVSESLARDVANVWETFVNEDSVGTIYNKTMDCKVSSMFGNLCESFVYFLSEDEEKEGEEKEELFKTEKKNKKTAVKLTRVTIDISDSESSDEEEISKLKSNAGLDEAVNNALSGSIASDMVSDYKNGVGKEKEEKKFRRVELIEDEGDDGQVIDEDVPVIGGKSAKAKNAAVTPSGEGQILFTNYMATILPICTLDFFKNGIDQIDEENESLVDSAVAIDSAVRLAAVLDPKGFLEVVGKFERCNYLGHLEDHCELLAMLGGR